MRNLRLVGYETDAQSPPRNRQYTVQPLDLLWLQQCLVEHVQHLAVVVTKCALHHRPIILQRKHREHCKSPNQRDHERVLESKQDQ